MSESDQKASAWDLLGIDPAAKPNFARESEIAAGGVMNADALSPDGARELARALWTAADQAEASTP